ncbi:MAG: hypothetical protein HRU40_18210 [Saprospiraceae bacterium]|nr:hypothetical protein [Saprospiraceae bacterium]
MKLISLFLALFFCILQVLFVHRMTLLPEEPFWTNPLTICDNFVFGILMAFSPRYPNVTAVLLVLITGYLTYRFWLWFLTKVSTWSVFSKQDAE